MSLVDSLVKEHQVLKNMLNEVKAIGIGKPEGREKLMKSKELLLDHLKKEDELLYPELKKLEGTQNISNSFQEEMKEISTLVLAFFNKYEKGTDEYEKGTDEQMEFAKDFGRLMGALNNRIAREEITLYAAYQNHVDR